MLQQTTVQWPQIEQRIVVPGMDGKHVSPRQALDFTETSIKSLTTTPNSKRKQKDSCFTEQLALNLLY